MNRFCIQHRDCLAYLRDLPEDCVDLILTDPAYESLEKHRKKGTTTRLKRSKASSNDWFPIFRNDDFEELLHQYYRVLRTDRHFYMFCDQETMFVVKPFAEDAGFKFWKPIVWDKVTLGMGYHYRARYEFILFFEKGKRKLNDLGVPDILTSKRVRNGYPTEKPVDLAETLIGQSTQPGELVMDTFLGSGAFGEAAIRQGRDFVGCDMQMGAIDAAAYRIADAGGRPQDDWVFGGQRLLFAY